MGLVIYHRDDLRVAEWLMAPVLKTGVPERVSGVRIPPLPPHSLLRGGTIARSRHVPWGDVSQTLYPCVMLSDYEPAPPRARPPAPDHSACSADSNTRRAAGGRS